MSSLQAKRRVLFVCLGNICRSPMAEAVFTDLAHKRGVLDRLEIDSAGTGHWHEGDSADPRTVEALRRRGVKIRHVARQIKPHVDLHAWDLVIVMDEMNHRDVLKLGFDQNKIHFMRSFDPNLNQPGAIVPDPYTGTESDFDAVFDMLVPACEGLLSELTGGGRGGSGSRGGDS